MMRDPEPPRCSVCDSRLDYQNNCAECDKRNGPKKRITKAEFEKAGGFANDDLFRLRTRAGGFRYYRSLAVTGADIAKIAANRLPGETMHAAIQRAAGK